MNHIYFWNLFSWALAIPFLILKYVCVPPQWVTAPIFSSLITYSFTLQLCAILICSLPFASTLMNLFFFCACTCLHEGHWSRLHRFSYVHVYPVKRAIFPRTQSLAKEVVSTGWSHCRGTAKSMTSGKDLWSLYKTSPRMEPKSMGFFCVDHLDS